MKEGKKKKVLQKKRSSVSPISEKVEPVVVTAKVSEVIEPVVKEKSALTSGALMKAKKGNLSTARPPPRDSIKVAEAPIDPDEDFCDLYLAVKMDTSASQCNLMVFHGESTADAMFRAENLFVCGKRMSPNDNVSSLLSSKGEDQDIFLVYIPSLRMEDVSVVEVAIPLSSWDDAKFFFSGFILYIEARVSCSVISYLLMHLQFRY